MRKFTNSKAVWAWCFYDWANSVFATTVIAAFFPGFFKAFWCSGVDTAISTARLGMGSAISGFIIAVLSPVLGALAGAGNMKKQFLGFFIALGALATGCLYFVPGGSWFAATAVFAIARIGFFLANLFYDAMLVDVSEPHTGDFISSLGFAVGYLGGGLLFVFNMLMYAKPQWFGFASAGATVRFSFITVCAWWAVFSIPLFVFVKQREENQGGSIKQIIRLGLRRLIVTTKDIIRIPSLLLFLVAYWFYIDGVNTVYMMATDYGLSIGIPLATLMIALLVVQFVAFPSSIAFGYIAEKIGAQKTILISIGIYILISLVGAWMVTTGRDFIMLACLLATAQGAIQALSRSMFANMVPRDRESDFFGFYNMVGKFAVVLGPALVAAVNWIGHVYHVNSITSARMGVSSITVMFVVGGAILLKVKNGAEKN